MPEAEPSVRTPSPPGLHPASKRPTAATPAVAAPPLVNPPVNLFLDNPLLPTVPLAQPLVPPLLVWCSVVLVWRLSRDML
ncbi:hypothetical protein [Streptomyces sp. NPDC053427]|uniref:hypothetical protein n=1 Tax=Streptomyces sp. NPDC053427 TaxID=3365701 RepID=UPI0037D74765